MKAAGLYLALGAAHLVACAPALSVSSELLRDTPEAVPRTPYDDVESAGGVRASRDPLSVLSKHRVPPAGSAVDDPALIPGLDDESMRQTRPGMPCPHAQAATDRNDVLVVYLGAIFLLLVIVMEGGKSIFARRGAIRLEDKQASPSTSVHATISHSERLEDEKAKLLV